MSLGVTRGCLRTIACLTAVRERLPSQSNESVFAGCLTNSYNRLGIVSSAVKTDLTATERTTLPQRHLKLKARCNSRIQKDSRRILRSGSVE